MSKTESGIVPIYYLDSRSRRIQQLYDAFAAHYNKEPDFYVRVPGRVNLIGEHIDYCGYGVCPMALEQDVLLAVSAENDKILQLNNVDDDYPGYKCDLENFSITLEDGAPQWHQYFLCGIKGIFEVLPGDTTPKGMKVVVSGNVLPNAGLSSSSALVSAAALATAHSHDMKMCKEKIANLCAECERYIGTQGGGMDQAIAFLAMEGCAKFIEFSPLRSTDITLPPGAVFVIAHSLAKLNKAATADFNCRVVECRLAAQIIAKKRGLLWSSIKKLGDLQKNLSSNLPEMITLVEGTLHEQPYTKEEVVRELETTSDHLEETSLTPNTKHIQSFKLRQRALHVFREALRVESFYKICSGKSGEKKALEALGQLMFESHASLRDLYECSHPQLDKLVELSRDHTLGSRLTGAGWGGCVVSLVIPKNLNKYMDMLKEKFYKKFGFHRCDSVLFATAPNSGACIYFERNKQ